MKQLFKLSVILCLLFISSMGLQAEEKKDVTNLGDWIAGGKLSGRFRTYYMNRSFDEPISQIQESLATGGWLEFVSARLKGFSIGLTGYTSQGLLFTDKNRDGANILAPGQNGYTVLGQSYIQWDNKNNTFRLYRQSIDTPFINSYDVKMIPVTCEAYTWENTSVKNCRVMLSHVTGIKHWTEREFISPSELAGFKNTKDPVTLLGVTYSPGTALKAQLWEYYCSNFMNVLYMQMDRTWKLKDGESLTGSIQAIHQKDLGRGLGGRFETGMIGVQGSYTKGRFNGALGYTYTGRGGDIENPWGGYYGFTSIMEEDCDLAGERAWVLGLNYDFKQKPDKGLSVSFYHTRAHLNRLGDISNPLQKETNLTFSYQAGPQCRIRLRGASVRNALDMGGNNFNDFRIIMDQSF